MGKGDLATRQYMQDPSRFADAFNFAIYGGSQVIRPEELRMLDSVTVERDGKGHPVSERRRDGLRLWQAMADGHAAYALLGLEDQTSVHYGMPVRCMTYDALSYQDQVDALVRENRKRRGLTKAEWLSGLLREDKLLPVVTLVLHFCSEPWDGATSLRDMLVPTDDALAACVSDYRINLISPVSMADEDFRRFKTELGIVLGYIRYAQDKDGLASYVGRDERFLDVSAESVGLINVLTDSRLEVPAGERRVNMCKAIEDMRAEARNEGIEQGIEQGARDRLLENVRSMVKNLKITAQQALDALDVPRSEQARYIAML